ncbi:MAG: hypothetical protein ACYSTS_16870 [Planctomycetota bacterium]|jgi:hypothetical protein
MRNIYRSIVSGLIVFLISFYSLPSHAEVTIMRIDFSGVVTSGPEINETYAGFFTYDATKYPAGPLADYSIFTNSIPLTGAEIDLYFKIGTLPSWDESTASVYRLFYDATSDLVLWGMGGDVNSPNAMQSGTDDFLKTVNLEYTTSQTPEIFNLRPVTWTITKLNTEPIPEPTTIALPIQGTTNSGDTIPNFAFLGFSPWSFRFE